MLKKSLSLVLAALFVFSFIAVATVSAEGGMTVTVMSVNVETGEVVVKDDAGEMKPLTADPKAMDLTVFKEGDMVVVETDEGGAITSIVAK